MQPHTYKATQILRRPLVFNKKTRSNTTPSDQLPPPAKSIIHNQCLTGEDAKNLFGNPEVTYICVPFKWPIHMTNKRYRTANCTIEIELAKSPHEVFDQVIDVAKWWPEEFEGDSIKPDSEFIFRSGGTHYSKNKVVEFVPDEKFVWLTTESIRKTDNYDWTGTKFILELTRNGDNTQLRFTYDGVVLEHEYDRLVQICDLTINVMLYDFITHGNANFRPPPFMG
jgi:hypothetical protein